MVKERTVDEGYWNRRVEALEWTIAWLLTRNERTAFFVDCEEAIIQDFIKNGDPDKPPEEHREHFHRMFEDIRTCMDFMVSVEPPS